MTFTKESARLAQQKSAASRKAHQAAAATPEVVPLVPKLPPPSPVVKESVSGVDWWQMPLNAAELKLKWLLAEYERATRIIEQRRSALPRKLWNCAVCDARMEDGAWKFKDDSIRDPKTGMVTPKVCCSHVCFTKYMATRPRSQPRR